MATYELNTFLYLRIKDKMKISGIYIAIRKNSIFR